MTHRPWRCCEETVRHRADPPKLAYCTLRIWQRRASQTCRTVRAFLCHQGNEPEYMVFECKTGIRVKCQYFLPSAASSLRSAANCGLLCCSDRLFFSVFFMTPAIFFERVCMLSSSACSVPTRISSATEFS